MQDTIKERFKFHYENDSTESILVINMGSKEKILEYQIEMIGNNSCPGILKLDVRYKNGDTRLHYNITSKLTLYKFLQRKKLNKNEFIDILLGITRPLIDCGEYLLYDKSFLIDEEYIYINPSTLEIGMIYLPLAVETNISEDFKSFLSNLIISSARMDEGSNGNYMAKILNYLKNDIFNIYDFVKLLQQLKGNESQIIRDMKNDMMESDVNRINDESIAINRDKYICPMAVEEEKHDNFIAHRGENAPEALKNNGIKQHESVIKNRYKRKYVFIAIASQMLIAIALSLSFNKIRAVAGDDLSTFAGIILIVAAVDILLFRKLFKKENMEETVVIRKNRKTRISHKNREKKMLKRNENDRIITKIEPKLPQENQIINMSKREIYNVNRQEYNVKGNDQVAAANEADDIPSVNINETIILDKERSEFPCLQRMNNGIMDRVSVTKSNFIIGRLANYVDYVIDNNAIGRTHAEILYKEEQYFIKDLNSKNGTYLNEEKLCSNKEYAISNEDKIIFANIEYKFIL
jgi:Tfp pilus assembly major pilin PilA